MGLDFVVVQGYERGGGGGRKKKKKKKQVNGLLTLLRPVSSVG